MSATLHGVGADQADQLAELLCMGGDLTDGQVLNLRTYHACDYEGPEHELIRGQLGGDTCRDWLFAALPERPLARLSTRLAALDTRMSERILGHLEAVFLAAVSRTAVKAADLVKRGGARGNNPLEWLDAQPQAVVRSALTALDESKVLTALDDLDDLVSGVLDEGAKDLAAILSAELGIDSPPDVLVPAAAREDAARVAKLSLTALVLGRLSRNDVEVSTRVPPNIARDVLHVAGGADSTSAGGVPKSVRGRVLVAGSESLGDGFATSDTVLDAIRGDDPTKNVETVLIWEHSGASDANEIHQANDGLRAADCDFRAGAPGGPRNCGCRWRTQIEVTA